MRSQRRRLPITANLILASALTVATAASDTMTITYAPFAKVNRGPNESVLPEGTRPCGAYPHAGSDVLPWSPKMTAPRRIQFKRSDYSVLNGAELHGMLFAEVIIDKTGHPRSVHVLRSVSPVFDELFFQEIRSSKYKPAELNGKAVPVCMVYTARPHYR